MRTVSGQNNDEVYSQHHAPHHWRGVCRNRFVVIGTCHPLLVGLPSDSQKSLMASYLCKLRVTTCPALTGISFNVSSS